ncbi:hypothetical protein GCM10009747_13680 [Agromyces humatus]|uniref:Uncharacterized protein n=1 Tax=Agromyces humatus TaxID=279573 RepID=A0ABP4WK00_9MICO
MDGFAYEKSDEAAVDALHRNACCAVEIQTRTLSRIVWDDPYPDSRLFGHKLSRDEALTHPLLPEFWILVDHILEHDPVVHAHFYD